VDVSSVLGLGGIRVHPVTGELFFASTNELARAFGHTDDVSTVVIDLSAAHVRDCSATATLDAVSAEFASRGVGVEITGLNPHGEQPHTRLSGELTGSH
jgi:sulfate permease, SulP family